MVEIDFEKLNDHLQGQVKFVLTTIIPGGRFVGHDYVAGSKLGGPGDSFKYNIEKYTGSDFATDETFGDLIDLYAKIDNIPNLKAAQFLAKKFGFLIEDKPKLSHYKFGPPTAFWKYHNAEGVVVLYVARYDTEDGKQYLPYSKVDGEWRMKSLPEPRPLYNLPEILANPERAVLIVEGEKAAEAAKITVKNVYTVTTWPHGSKSVNKADWTPLYGRKILIWPDADNSGVQAAHQIAFKLFNSCPEIKIINVDGEKDGCDAADFNFTWLQFKEWAIPRARIYQKPATELQAAKQEPKHTNPTESASITAIQVNINQEIDVPLGSHMSIWDKAGVALTNQGMPICNIDNCIRVMETLPHFKNFVWYDVFYRRMFTYFQSKEPRYWTSDDELKLTLFFQREIGFQRITNETVYKAVRTFAVHNAKNEPHEWANSLSWDGTSRINTFFIDICGTPDNEYTRAVSRNFWISLVSRILSPGCKVDTMVMLEGKQGQRKSTLLELIAGPKWYTVARESVTSTNFYQCLSGKLIIEFADLQSFAKAEIEAIKAMLSCHTDTYRAPYDRVPDDHPRTSIFAGTTNEQVYLRDSTGARRFWPIYVNKIDIPQIRELHDQYFAEAAEIFKQGLPWLDDRRPEQTRWWEVPETAEEEQEARRQVDPWEEMIAEYVCFKDQITSNEIMSNCLKIDPAKKSRSDEMRVGGILRLLGMERKRVMMGKIQKWVYCKKVGKGEEILAENW